MLTLSCVCLGTMAHANGNTSTFPSPLLRGFWQVAAEVIATSPPPTPTPDLWVPFLPLGNAKRGQWGTVSTFALLANSLILLQRVFWSENSFSSPNFTSSLYKHTFGGGGAGVCTLTSADFGAALSRACIFWAKVDKVKLKERLPVDAKIGGRSVLAGLHALHLPLRSHQVHGGWEAGVGGSDSSGFRCISDELAVILPKLGSCRIVE